MIVESIEAVADRLAKRTEAFECLAVQRRELSASFEAGKLKSAQASQRGGVSLRVVVGGRLAGGGTADPAALDKTIDSVIESADFGDRCEFQFVVPAPPPPCADLFDQTVSGMQADRLAATGWELLDRLGDLGPGATVNVGLEAGQTRRAFINSAGQRFDCQATHLGVSLAVEFFGQDDIFSVWEFQESCRADLDLVGLVNSVRTKFQQARQVVPAGRPDQPIVFTPHALHGLLVPLLAGLNGQNVADGVSPLADKRGGQPILDEKFSLIDDGTLPGRPGSQPFDDEGVPTQRTALVANGRIDNFLLDLRSAARLKLTSTGNAARGLVAPPAPATSNLIVTPGGTPYARLIGELADGLLVEYLLGVGQGNVVAGDYANPIGLAYKVRDGQVVGRVKNCSLAGNVYQDLRHLAAVEDRGHWHGPVCLPHLRIDTMRLAVGG